MVRLHVRSSSEAGWLSVFVCTFFNGGKHVGFRGRSGFEEGLALDNPLHRQASFQADSRNLSGISRQSEEAIMKVADDDS